MNKKLIILGVVIGFIIISGVYYSYSRLSKSGEAVSLITTLSEDDVDNSNKKADANSLNTDTEKTLEEDPNIDKIDESKEPDVSELGDEVSEHSVIYVHLCGAVKHPGVYQVDTGTRLYDVIQVSGGLTGDAAGDFINQAQEVTDGQRIYIPSKEEVKELELSDYIANPSGDYDNSQKNDKTSELVNINTADKEELMTLPGIGHAKADSIIEYRLANGKFMNTEDIMNIPGIKEGLYRKISSYITVK
ncbi:helix-hairpin-helix domain-containing protein [Lachnospiraceae bacterium MD1]|uniref:Helix-hairpin-helix domain-containing protein n=1 Tax=Variimorphobacter saccharofermentans TaxID=2755051 RepID=A0A839JYA1_9FIRM|nr:helix-hairpin-helix domain-containing protein [Variimorphobacter saccharofermentans]MBB2182645.1 helix-hairpin-helix domain-containing protein [Variimorphobacter saccharofermentans]